MTYTQKMLNSIISAVLIGGILISMLRIDNKVGFGILVGTVTYILLSLNHCRQVPLITAKSEAPYNYHCQTLWRSV